MTLGIRNIIAVLIIGLVFLAGNILLVASWLADKGVEEKGNWIRQEFLTGSICPGLVSPDLAPKCYFFAKIFRSPLLRLNSLWVIGQQGRLTGYRQRDQYPFATVGLAHPLLVPPWAQ